MYDYCNFIESGYIYLYVGQWCTVWDSMFYTENSSVKIYFTDRSCNSSFPDIYQKQDSGQSL